MTNDRLKAGRLKGGLTQKQTAEDLGVSQSDLSQLDMGQRLVTPELARAATALPMLEPATEGHVADAAQLARQLSGLGYPGFAHLCPQKANPAAVVLDALLQNDLESRLAEALPWVLLTYPDLDWVWLVRHGKLHDVQNRLGFLVALAKGLAADRPEVESAFNQLSAVEQQVEHARLAGEDTLCRETMPVAERSWLKAHRSALARHWNLLTGLTADQLSYAR